MFKHTHTPLSRREPIHALQQTKTNRDFEASQLIWSLPLITHPPTPTRSHAYLSISSPPCVLSMAVLTVAVMRVLAGGRQDKTWWPSAARQAVLTGGTDRSICMPSLHNTSIQHVEFFLIQGLLSQPVPLTLCARVIAACLQLCNAVQTPVLAVHHVGLWGKVDGAITSSGGRCDVHFANANTAGLAWLSPVFALL